MFDFVLAASGPLYSAGNGRAQRRDDGGERTGGGNASPVLLFRLSGRADRVLEFLHGQRSALQLHPAAAAKPGAQGDAARNPLHPGPPAAAAASGSHQTHRGPDVHDGPVQRHLRGSGDPQVFLLQARLSFLTGDPAGQPLPG